MVLEAADIIKQRKAKTTEQLPYSDQRIQKCRRENEFLISNNETKRSKFLPNYETSNTNKIYSSILVSPDYETEEMEITNHYTTNSNNNINVCAQNSSTWAETLAGDSQRDEGITGQHCSNAGKSVLLHNKDFITRPTDIACNTETDCGAIGDHVAKNELLIKGTAVKDLKEVKPFVMNSSSLRGAYEQTVNCCHICCNPAHFLMATQMPPYHRCPQPECFCNCPQHLVDPTENDCCLNSRCCNCRSQSKKRTPQLLNSYGRKCTDLQTNLFYNRTSECRSPSPDRIKNEKYFKVQQNEKTKMKEKLLREEQIPGRRREHGEKSHKDKRVNKERNNITAFNRQKSTKTRKKATMNIDITTRLEKRIIETLGHETVSKLVHILDRFANEEEKQLNKAMEETFEDAKHKSKGSFNVIREREERIRRTSSRPPQPTRDNFHNFTQTCTVDPLKATQYSKGTLEMMKKMRIKEYKSVKPKAKENWAANTQHEVINENIYTHLKQARLQNYGEYIMKYKSQNIQQEDKSDYQASIVSDRTYTKDMGDSSEEHIYACGLAPNREWNYDCSRNDDSDLEVMFKRNNTFIYKSYITQRERIPNTLGDRSESTEKSVEPISYRTGRGRSPTRNILKEDKMTISNNQHTNRSKNSEKAKENHDNKKDSHSEECRKQREIVTDDNKSKQKNDIDTRIDTQENNFQCISPQYTPGPNNYQKNNTRDLTEEIKAGVSYTIPPSSEQNQYDSKNEKTLKRDSFSGNRGQLIDCGKINRVTAKQELYYYGSVRGTDSLDEQISYNPSLEKGQKAIEITEDHNRYKKSIEEQKVQDETDVKRSNRTITARKLLENEQSTEYEMSNNYTKGIEGKHHNKDKADIKTKNQDTEPICNYSQHKVSNTNYPYDNLSTESTTKESHHLEYVTPDNLTACQNNTIDTLKCLRDILNSYQKGLLEDNSLNELAGDLMIQLGSCKCSQYNEASRRLSQDKSTITLPEKQTIQTQYSEQEAIEDFTSTKSNVKTELNELKDFSNEKTQETFAETKDTDTNIENEICHLSYLQENLISAENVSDIGNQMIQKKVSLVQTKIAQVTAVSSNKEFEIEPTYLGTPVTFYSHTKMSHQTITDSNLFEKQEVRCLSLEDVVAETPLKSLSKTKAGAVKDEEVTNVENCNITGHEHQVFPCRKATSNPHIYQDLTGTISSGTLCENYRLEEEGPCHEARPYKDSNNETNYQITTETQYDSIVIEHCEKSGLNDLPGVCEDKAQEGSLHKLCAESKNYIAESGKVINVSEASNREFQKWCQCLMSEEEAYPLSFASNTYIKSCEAMDRLLQQSGNAKTKCGDHDKPSLKSEMDCYKESNHYNPDYKQYQILKQTTRCRKKNPPLSTCFDDLPELPQCSCMMSAFVEMLGIYYQDAGKQPSNRLLNC